MKRQKPNFIKDWADEFTPFSKWFSRKLERTLWKRQIENDKEEYLTEHWLFKE